MSSSSSTFDKKINELEKSLNEAKTNMKNKKCIPYVVIVGIIIPFLTWIVLYMSKPSFIKNTDDEEQKTNMKKLFLYTVLITVLFWAGLYGYSYYRGFENLTSLCF